MPFSILFRRKTGLDHGLFKQVRGLIFLHDLGIVILINTVNQAANDLAFAKQTGGLQIIKPWQI